MSTESEPTREQQQGIHLMAKPIGPLCNLDCSYCFYLEKEVFFSKQEKFRMSEQVLSSYVQRYIEAQPGPEVEFTWQGGEPTLMGLEFFALAVKLQRQFATGKAIRNTLQTNGTLLNDEWGEFLAREEFLVGLSLDGPQELHDIHRYDKQNKSSFSNTLRGLDVLRRHAVPFNVLVTVSREVSQEPIKVYRFLKEQGVTHVQFNPVVERVAQPSEQVIGLHFSRPPVLSGTTRRPELSSGTVQVTQHSVEPHAYGDFLIEIYKEWVRLDVGTVFVMNFEWALAAWGQLPATVCLFSARCGKAAIVEHDGNVYSCDHFMFPEYLLGNLKDNTVADLMNSERQTAFGAAKEILPRVCRDCTYLFACHGECPKNRFATSRDGEAGLNYLCPSYLKFFSHITPTMNAMAKLVEHGQPAAMIMEALKGPLLIKL